MKIEELTDQQLENLIENHRRKNAFEQPIYLDALAERARRKGQGLNFDKSYRIIRQSAENGEFLSYKDLADASGAEWSRVHYGIGKHLWDLVEYAHRKGWPMLSAIVVNKPHVKTGNMEPDSLKGFITAARQLGLTVTDENEFLREQQRLVFEWAQSTSKKD